MSRSLVSVIDAAFVLTHIYAGDMINLENMLHTLKLIQKRWSSPGYVGGA